MTVKSHREKGPISLLYLGILLSPVQLSWVTSVTVTHFRGFHDTGSHNFSMYERTYSEVTHEP